METESGNLKVFDLKVLTIVLELHVFYSTLFLLYNIIYSTLFLLYNIIYSTVFLLDFAKKVQKLRTGTHAFMIVQKRRGNERH